MGPLFGRDRSIGRVVDQNGCGDVSGTGTTRLKPLKLGRPHIEEKYPL